MDLPDDMWTLNLSSLDNNFDFSAFEIIENSQHSFTNFILASTELHFLSKKSRNCSDSYSFVDFSKDHRLCKNRKIIIKNSQNICSVNIAIQSNNSNNIYFGLSKKECKFNKTAPSINLSTSEDVSFFMIIKKNSKNAVSFTDYQQNEEHKLCFSFTLSDNSVKHFTLDKLFVANHNHEYRDKIFREANQAHLRLYNANDDEEMCSDKYPS